MSALMKVGAVAFFLYLFLLGIGGMGEAFKLMGKDTGKAFLETASGPFVSLMIGILATTLVQSSSTTTSLVIGMVGGNVLGFDQAVFMIMGANLGTTVTNTLVSLGHIAHSTEYKRAFAAATVHDFFNILTLIVLFPLEVYTKTISTAATWCANEIGGAGFEKFSGPVKAATKPVIKFATSVESGLAFSPTVLLVVSVVFMFVGLIFMVKNLKSLMMTRLENLFDRVLFKTPGRSLVLGIFLTFLVQSSSITTSVAVPLVGAGVITIRQVFPYTLGANIGTTMTGVLATAAVANPAAALPVAFFHIIFNSMGVGIFWFFRGLPIAIAEKFAELAMWNRLIPLAYIVVVFYILPFLAILIAA
jgi:sodium-dependent phosphate cotransporter